MLLLYSSLYFFGWQAFCHIVVVLYVIARANYGVIPLLTVSVCNSPCNTFFLFFSFFSPTTVLPFQHPNTVIAALGKQNKHIITRDRRLLSSLLPPSSLSLAPLPQKKVKGPAKKEKKKIYIYICTFNVYIFMPFEK